MTVRMSVVIPAHNEAAVIERLLTALMSHDQASDLELVVVANGCTDDTASRARAVDERIRVVELPEASKIAALSAGDAAAAAFPRAYVDADVDVDTPTLLALAEALEQPDGPLVASPRLLVDSSQSSWAVRQHFRVWALSDYRTSGHIGSGIYALSAEGRERFGAWPQVIADDRFVQQLFRPDERHTLSTHTFTVRSPRTLSALMRRSTRIARGNRELPAASSVQAPTGQARHLGLLGRVLRRPTLWVPLGVYSVTSTVPRLLARREIARRQARAWHRDDTTRVAS